MNPAEIISHAAFELQPFATRALKECADGFFNHPFMYCRTLTSVSYIFKAFRNFREFLCNDEFFLFDSDRL